MKRWQRSFLSIIQYNTHQKETGKYVDVHNRIGLQINSFEFTIPKVV